MQGQLGYENSRERGGTCARNLSSVNQRLLTINTVTGDATFSSPSLDIACPLPVRVRLQLMKLRSIQSVFGSERWHTASGLVASRRQVIRQNHAHQKIDGPTIAYVPYPAFSADNHAD